MKFVTADAAPVPQPKDKCQCGHVFDKHNGVAMECWADDCGCPGFREPLESVRFPVEVIEVCGAD